MNAHSTTPLDGFWDASVTQPGAGRVTHPCIDRGDLMSDKPNLELRAAKHFGIHTEPRTSVKVDRWSCFIVTRRGKTGAALAYYSEKYPQQIHAEYWWITDTQRAALAAALESGQGKEKTR